MAGTYRYTGTRAIVISQYNAGSGRPIGLAVAYLGPGLQGIFRMRMYQYQRLERARPSFFPVAINNRASPCFSRCYWIGLRSGHTVWFLHQNTTLEMSCTIILMHPSHFSARTVYCTRLSHQHLNATNTFLCNKCNCLRIIRNNCISQNSLQRVGRVKNEVYPCGIWCPKLEQNT